MRRTIARRRNPGFADFDSLFENFFSPGLVTASAPHTGFQPRVDVRETEEGYLFSADVPGLSGEEIKVEVHDGILSLSGERKTEHESDENGVHRIERSFGHFERRFQLPSKVDTENIQAHHENGVLEILVPKTEVAKPKTIEVNTEKGGLFSKLLHGSKKDPQ